MKQILLVLHEKSDIEDMLLQQLDGIVKKHLSADKDIVPTCDYNQYEAELHIKANRYLLMVSELYIPYDRKRGILEKERRGLELLKCIKKEQPNAPCILLVNDMDRSLNALIPDGIRCEVVQYGQRQHEDLIRAVNYLLSTAPIQEHESDRVDVVVALKDNSPTATYKICRRGPTIHAYDGSVPMKKELIDRLFERTKDLKTDLEYREWVHKLHKLGQDVFDLLNQNPRFSKDFWGTIGTDGISNCRFLFETGKLCHAIALEAIVDGEDARFWMLEAPVARRLLLDDSPILPVLFEDDETRDSPINCLIIESDVSGRIDGLAVREGKKEPIFEELANVPDEANWLESFLNKKEHIKPIVPIGEIRRINQEKLPAGISFHQCVEDCLLKEGPWHIVHFAGHSYFDEEAGENGSAYVIFPGKECGEAVSVMAFAKWLRRSTRFVYMSSCRSSEMYVIRELTRNLVPAVVGYRWDIKDDRAAKHAQVFYEDLLGRSRSIEYAFLKARQEAYQNWQDERTWVAPMLILQRPR